jgi:hypothetical protein
MMRDRFLPQYMIELCTKESLILVKAHSKFLLLTVQFTYELAPPRISWILLLVRSYRQIQLICLSH